MQLMILRSEEDSIINDWLKKKSDKYTSPEIQNELLKIMAISVLCQVISLVQDAPLLFNNGG